jgi:hypothetical protein
LADIKNNWEVMIMKRFMTLAFVVTSTFITANAASSAAKADFAADNLNAYITAHSITGDTDARYWLRSSVEMSDSVLHDYVNERALRAELHALAAAAQADAQTAQATGNSPAAQKLQALATQATQAATATVANLANAARGVYGMLAGLWS